MIIIPITAFQVFEERAGKYGITQIRSNPVSFVNNYVLINQTEQLKLDFVQIVTQIFQIGEVEILIGVNLVEEIKMPFPEEKEYKAVKSLYLCQTIKNLFITLGSMVTGYLEGMLEGVVQTSRTIKTMQDLYIVIMAIFAGGILFFGRRTYRAFRLYLKYRDISKDIRQIGNALLNSLSKEGVINTDISTLNVVALVDDFGAVSCHLEGGTTFEKSAFINALCEIIAPDDNPHYVIIRKSKLMNIIAQKDYHAVPEALGRNKNVAEYFRDQWE